MPANFKPSKIKKIYNLKNLLGRVYDRFVKIKKYQQRVKEKLAAQKARLVNTKEKVKQNIRQRRMKK